MMPIRLLPTGSSVGQDDRLASRAERAAAAHAPAYVVVDDDDTVALFSGATAKFLEPAGFATLDLLRLVPHEVAPELRALLRWSRATGRAGRTNGLIFSLANQQRVVNLVVEPLPSPADEPHRLMVLFQDGGLDHERASDQRGRIDRVEAELRLTELQVQYAAAKVSASEAQCRRSSEQLEATVEELEATSERLQTANTRLAELDRSSADTRHMLEGSDAAIVFLDARLCIRSFTPAARALLTLRDTDRGRRMSETAAHIVYPDLHADVCQVNQSQQPVEREVNGRAEGVRHLVRILPYRNADALVAGVVLAFIDVTMAHRADQARRETEERLQRIAASVPAFLFIAGNSREWDYVNPPFYAFTGLAEGAALREGWRACVHPADWEAAQRVWTVAAAAGGIVEHEIRIRRADEAWCWFIIRAIPQLDPDGHVVRWYGSCADIDRRRRAEGHQGLVLAELQLRVKTIVANVRSLFMGTLGSSDDLEHFAHHFGGRVEALARSQRAVARTPDCSVMLEELVTDELAAHGGRDDRQTNVRGPAVALPAGEATAIGLALHELATNAVKYGALSTPTGKVDVRWRHEAGDLLTIEWEESGVPLIDVNPARRGFGRELIERGLPQEIGAVTRLAFRPGGAFCAISFGLDGHRSGSADAGEPTCLAVC